MNNRAFTLIELLLVVCLMIASILFIFISSNPFEKIREARDNDKILDSKELLSAFSSYKSKFGSYPFLKTPDKTISSSEELGLKELLDKREIREDFYKRSNLEKIYISASTDGSLVACFSPESKKYKAQSQGLFCVNSLED